MAPPKLPALRLDLLHQGQEQRDPNAAPALQPRQPLSARGVGVRDAGSSMTLAREASEGWKTDRPAAQQVHDLSVDYSGD